MENINLDFEKHDTLYATHGIHAYAAKCPPQLAKYGIENYSKPGETVLDPMVGSGTTMVEARLSSRNGIGYDIDPLACLISKVKSSVIEDDAIDKAFDAVLPKVTEDIRLLSLETASHDIQNRARSPLFLNNEYWFNPKVAQALALLSYHIANTQITEQVRDFLWVALSSLILAKNSVANARDIIHSRHHYYNHTEAPNVLERFSKRVHRMKSQSAAFRKMCEGLPESQIKIEQSDARKLNLPNDSVDLVFTSPPYATALDYPRAHFLAIPWIENAINITLENYLGEASHYIGSERGKLTKEFEIDSNLLQLSLTSSILSELNQASGRHAKVIQRYFLDMYQVLQEMVRVLKPKQHAIIVVCPSNIRKVDVPTHNVFTEIGEKVGLQKVSEHTRTISNHRRLLPYIKEAFGSRMSTEYVQVFRKI